MHQIGNYYNANIIGKCVDFTHFSGILGGQTGEENGTPVLLPGKSRGRRSLCSLQSMGLQTARHD